MKKLTKLLFTLVLVSMMFSCSNDEFSSSTEIPSSQLKNIEFIYDGITYTSTYTINEDSVFVFDNQNVAEIYEKISAFPDLCTYIHPNGVEEYFENSDVALNRVFTVGEENSQLRATSAMYGSIALYEHKDMGGKRIDYSFQLNSGFCLQLPNLIKRYPIPSTITEVNFNDLMTSFVIYNNDVAGRVILYEHINYGGRSIIFTFSSAQSPYKEYNLSKYVIRKPGLFNHSVTWNDYVSSLKIAF